MTAAALGLAFAPAAASAQDASQQVTDSTGAAQVGTTEVAPTAAANAPVTANAPITVASPNSGGDASQSGGSGASSGGSDGSSGESEASSGGSDGSSGGSGDQDVTGSSGGAQVGPADVSPAAAANAPVTANAPITVLSPDSGGDATQTGSSQSSASSGDGTGTAGDQDVSDSSGAAQVGSVGGSPNAAAGAPVTANAPITVLSPNSGGDAAQPGGSSASAASDGGSASDEQDATGSSGSAQVADAGASPSAAAAAPVTGNAPVTILSPDSGGDSTGSGGRATATQSGSAGSGGQDTGESTGSLQVGSLALAPGFDAAAPVTTNTPVTILSPSSGGDATTPGGDTPTDPGGETPGTPTSPDSQTPPQSSPPGTDDDDDETTAGGGGTSGPTDGDPIRGRLGVFQPNDAPGTTTATEQRTELGAPAGDLPFTGLLLWLTALAGGFLLAIGTRGQQLTTA